MSSIAQTLTNGIQEVSAILPLLGTEQCEEQVGLALNNGFLYAAITPISLFGSLGIVKAGFNTLLASIAVQRYHLLGAKMLVFMGFHPKGGVSESISIDEEHRGRFLVESQLERLLEDEHIDDIEALRLEAAPGCIRWNIFMTLFTLIIPSALGITPYLFIINQTSKSQTSFAGFPVWAFPITRILCNVLCTVTVQFIIQYRILKIVKMRLIFNIVDRFAKKNGYSISKYVHPWNKGTSSEMCLWALQEQHALWKELEEAAPSCSQDKEKVPGDKSRVWPDREKRDKVDTLLQKQFIRHFPKRSLFTKIHRTKWINIVLFFTLLMSIPGSVLGYIGCFNAVSAASTDDNTTTTAETIAPILWLGLEGLLCFIRILVWALNPNWDDCGGIAFCMQLIQKCPLVTCNMDGEELEKSGFAPVMREGEFLSAVTSYSGPMASFDHQGTVFYYIFTRKRKEDAKKNLYVVVSDYKEQTSRIFIRNDKGDGFRSYVSTLVPDTESHFSSVSVRFHVNDSPNQRKAAEMKQASDPDFMSSFEKHYRAILTRMEPKPPDSSIEKRLRFRRGWTIGKMEEWGDTTEIVYTRNPNFFAHAFNLTGQMTLELWRKLTIWKPTKEENGPRGSASRHIDEDEHYIAFGQKERRAGRFLDDVEKWTQIYLEAIHKDLRMSSRVKSGAESRNLGFGRKMLSIIEAYEEHEVEFLLHEARVHMEMLLLRQLPLWRRFLAGEHAAMAETVLEGSNFDNRSQFWKERLSSRLSTEWKFSQKHLAESRLSRAIHRLEEHSNRVRERVARQKYDRAITTNMLDRWRRHLEFDQFKEDTIDDDVNIITNEILELERFQHLERECERYQASLSERFRMRWPKFYDELNAENTRSKVEERLHFRRLFMQLESMYITKARTLFHMLGGQLEHIDQRAQVLRQVSTDSQHYKMSLEEEQEKLRFIQDHKFLKITHTSFEVFGGLPRICEILKQIRGISAIDFDDNLEIAFDDFEEIKNTVQQMKTITGVFLPGYSDHPEISMAIKANVDEISNTDNVCFYEYLRVADHCRIGEPYLYFDTPEHSVCMVKFRVQTKEDHVLTLRHCFKGWWGEKGEIEVAVNGIKLPQSWGLAPTPDKFGDEDINLPHEVLNLDGINELEIRLKGGTYHLSDVFVPAIPAKVLGSIPTIQALSADFGGSTNLKTTYMHAVV